MDEFGDAPPEEPAAKKRRLQIKKMTKQGSYIPSESSEKRRFGDNAPKQPVLPPTAASLPRPPAGPPAGRSSGDEPPAADGVQLMKSFPKEKVKADFKPRPPAAPPPMGVLFKAAAENVDAEKHPQEGSFEMQAEKVPENVAADMHLLTKAASRCKPKAPDFKPSCKPELKAKLEKAKAEREKLKAEEVPAEHGKVEATMRSKAPNFKPSCKQSKVTNCRPPVDAASVECAAADHVI